MPSNGHAKTHRSKSYRHKSARSSRGRCMRPGPISRNPYLNFLREFRKKCCGYSAIESVKRGAKVWNALSREEKLRYIKEAFYARKRRHMSSTVCVPVRRVMSRKRSRRPKKSTHSSRGRDICSRG